MSETLSASPAPPTMTNKHLGLVRSVRGFVRYAKDANGGPIMVDFDDDFSEAVLELEAVVRSLASKTHVLVPWDELERARTRIRLNEGDARSVAILNAKIDRWLSTPLPSEKDET